MTAPGEHGPPAGRHQSGPPGAAALIPAAALIESWLDRAAREKPLINRTIGIVSLLLMFGANVALVLRDVVPGLLAGQPPNPEDGLTPGARYESQLAILDAEGQVVGRNWTIAQTSGITMSVQSSTLLLPIRLPNGVQTPVVRIDTELGHQEGRIDSLAIRLVGLGVRTELKGAFFPPDQFPCEWQVGDARGTFLLSSDATRVFGDEFRPFYRLPGLYVGRAWRVKLINPLSQLLPSWGSRAFAVDATLVRVVGREKIPHLGRTTECFRVEADRAVTWVDDAGRVIRTDVEIPVLGKLSLVDEPFDDEARRAAIQRIRPGA